MDRIYSVGVLVGSLRKGSYTRMVAGSLMELAPKSLNCDIVEIGGLSFFDQDLEGDPPRDWVDFRDRIRPLDAVLFATAEYNRSIPGVLKNALDVGSRPYGQSVWDGKPGAIVSVSPGAMGGFGANHHLRQVLTFLNVATMQQPEAYLAGVSKLLDDSGNLTNDNTREFLRKFMAEFGDWVRKIKGG